jgi:hypothetical protein
MRLKLDLYLLACTVIFVGGPVGGKEPLLKLPTRPADAMSGSAFFGQIRDLPWQERETAVLREIKRGNVPEFLRRLRAIELAADGDKAAKHKAICFVTPDYLGVGSDEDFFRVPMTPMAGQEIADACEASLLTAKLSDAIWQQAEVKLEPRPLTKDRDAAATFYQHHQIVEEQRQGKELGLLVAGIKKDIVLTNRLKERSHRVAIYGWHYPSGKPIQQVYVGHVDWYVDYSHGIRLVSRRMIVDERERDLAEVLKDKELSGLVSSEGPIEAGYKQ